MEIVITFQTALQCSFQTRASLPSEESCDLPLRPARDKAPKPPIKIEREKQLATFLPTTAMTAQHRTLSSSSTSPVVNTISLPDPDWTRTNTLAVTSMPVSFFNPLILEALRAHFEAFGEIHTWAPLKAFSRVLVIYYDEEAAELAKESCDSLFVDATDFRCVFPSLDTA